MTLWRVRVTILRWKYKNASVYDVGAVHVTVNYTKMLSVAQQCFCGKFVTENKANFIYKFVKESYFIFTLSHVTYKGFIETKESSFAHGLL